MTRSRARPAALRVGSLAELKALKNALRERERLAAEQAAQRAAQAAARAQERQWFARAVGPVTPLAQASRVLHLRQRPAPEPLQRRRDEAQVLVDSMSDELDPTTLLETDDQLSYRRWGIGVDVLRKLRRGAWVVQGQIDLHGHTREQAREALGRFLQEAGKRGWRCVRVVHGKGLGSPGREPVLKAKVRGWLVQRQEVLAFTLAPACDGGAGAVIVLLDSSLPRQAR